MAVMTSPSSSRESRLVLLAPSALVLIVFAFVFNADQQQLLTRRNDEFERAQKAVPSTSELVAASRKLGDLRREQKQLTDSETRLQDKLQQQAARFSGADERNQRIRQLIEHLRSHNLEISGGSPAKKQGSLPEPLHAVTSRLRQKPGFQEPEVYEVHIIGSYPNVLGALQELKGAQDGLLPLRIVMEKSETGQLLKQWTLYVLV